MKTSKTDLIYLVRAVLLTLGLGAALAACASDELKQACEDYCAESDICDEENGQTLSETCYSFCLDFRDESWVEQHNECIMEYSSCAYRGCASESNKPGK